MQLDLPCLHFSASIFLRKNPLTLVNKRRWSHKNLLVSFLWFIKYDRNCMSTMKPPTIRCHKTVHKYQEKEIQIRSYTTMTLSVLISLLKRAAYSWYKHRGFNTRHGPPRLCKSLYFDSLNDTEILCTRVSMPSKRSHTFCCNKPCIKGDSCTLNLLIKSEGRRCLVVKILDSWSEGCVFNSCHCHICLQPWASCFTSIALVLWMRHKTEVPCTWCLCQWQAKDPIQVRNMSSLWWTPPPRSKTESLGQ
jgi:hypothetical protein